MDHGEPGFSGSNMEHIFQNAPPPFPDWGCSSDDQAVWATEEDYGAWNGVNAFENFSNAAYNAQFMETRSPSEPPNKKARNPQSNSQYDRDRDLSSVNRSRAIGKMFFKTKLCCKFRAGICPFITNCNFAHGIEELRKPPPNWQEIVAEERGTRALEINEGWTRMSEPREEHQIPSLGSSDLVGETQRSYKGRHCKKFYTDEGCPYGSSCTFLHDEQSRARESVAISLGPTYGANGSGSHQKPSNWKTRICNKWETTRNCPFGSKCHFAHGAAELHRYGGGLVDDGRESATSVDVKQPVPLRSQSDGTSSTNLSSNHTVDVYHPSQRSISLAQRPCQRSLQKWKGPDRISRIYGDWIDDDKWDQPR